MEQLDEISRRDFLKGAGAAAVAGAASSASADWKQEPSHIDKMDNKEYRRFKNLATNGFVALQYNPDIDSARFQLKHEQGHWIPEFSNPLGRIKVDDGPVIPVAFWIPSNAPGYAMIMPQGANSEAAASKIDQYLLSAKKRILVDATQLVRRNDQFILTFNIQNMEESLEETSPEAIAKIDQITRR